MLNFFWVYAFLHFSRWFCSAILDVKESTEPLNIEFIYLGRSFPLRETTQTRILRTLEHKGYTADPEGYKRETAGKVKDLAGNEPEHRSILNRYICSPVDHPAYKRHHNKHCHNPASQKPSETKKNPATRSASERRCKRMHNKNGFFPCHMKSIRETLQTDER
jgi:hypothetical protein